MVRVPVTSSVIASIGYDVVKEILEVEFQSGAVYQYECVPEVEHAALMAAESTGTYFNVRVRDRYRSRRL